MAKQPLRKKATSKKQLNDGLSQLLGGSRLDQALEERPEDTIRELSRDFARIPMERIQRNPDQPRIDFEEGPLEELANSIKTHGIIQPLTLRHLGDGNYQIISGERRFRASKMAGLTEVPAFIRVANDQTLLEMALVENIQRRDLNPMEVAYSYYRLANEYNLKHEEVAARVGKQRSTVSNYFRLLEVVPDVVSAIKNRSITMGAAKAIAGIKDHDLQKVFLDEILQNDDWNVRQIEKAADGYKKNKSAKKTSRPGGLNADQERVLQTFKDYFGAKGTKLVIEDKDSGKGYLQIPFADSEHLHEMFKAVEIL